MANIVCDQLEIIYCINSFACVKTQMDWCMLRVVILTLSLWNCCMCTDFAGASVDESNDKKSGVINFSTPDLSDEEAHSRFMPTGLKCDGCLVVAYQVRCKKKKIDRRYVSCLYLKPLTRYQQSTKTTRGPEINQHRVVLTTTVRWYLFDIYTYIGLYSNIISGYVLLITHFVPSWTLDWK